MKPCDLMEASAFSLTLIATPAMLSAQGTPPPETPLTPEIPMPPGAPNPSLPPDEVPAQPATPDLPPEHIASPVASHVAQRMLIRNVQPLCRINARTRVPKQM